MNIGITGQIGFIGTHLFNYLSYCKEGYTLIPFEDSYFDDTAIMDKFVSSCDVIFHFAAVNRHHDINELFAVNIALVQKLIDAMERTSSKPHVYFSSSTQEEKNNIYGNSKKEGRKLLVDWAKRNNAGFTGLIIPNVFGPFGRPFYNSVVSTFSHQVIIGESPKIEIDAELNLIYVGELVEYIAKLIQSNLGKLVETELVPYTYTIKVSSILELLKKYKADYFDTAKIPLLTNRFEINLFNTFRSYIKPQEFFPYLYKKNEDSRGIFVETMRLEIGGQVSFSTTVPGITRGNHFHTRKIERFAVIKGKATIQLRKIGTSEIFEFALDGSSPAFVDMPVWYTHNITNVGDEELITMFWINEFYNPDDPDTFFEKV